MVLLLNSSRLAEAAVLPYRLIECRVIEAMAHIANSAIIRHDKPGSLATIAAAKKAILEVNSSPFTSLHIRIVCLILLRTMLEILRYLD